LWETKDIGYLGDGSDYTAFIQYLGVPSIDIRLVSSDSQYSAVYHSIYDSYYWAKHFAENNMSFDNHKSITRAAGYLALNFIDSPVLPFDYGDYARSIRNAFRSVIQTAPSLNYTNINNAMDQLEEAGIMVKQNLSNIENNLIELRALNDRLMKTEQLFLGDEMLSSRKWYKHVIFAPSLNDSYASTAFPAIRNAIAQQDMEYAQFLTDRIAQVILNAAKFLMVICLTSIFIKILS